MRNVVRKRWSFGNNALGRIQLGKLILFSEVCSVKEDVKLSFVSFEGLGF